MVVAVVAVVVEACFVEAMTEDIGIDFVEIFLKDIKVSLLEAVGLLEGQKSSVVEGCFEEDTVVVVVVALAEFVVAD